MPSRRKGRKPTVHREPTPTPPPEVPDTDEEDDEEEEEGPADDEGEPGAENVTHQCDPQSLEDEDIWRVLVEAWQSYNQLPALTRELYDLRYRRRKAGLMVPSSMPDSNEEAAPVSHGSVASRTETHDHLTVDTARTSLSHAPYAATPTIPPQANPPPLQSVTSANRPGLRSRDQLRLTERAQKLYRR